MRTKIGSGDPNNVINSTNLITNVPKLLIIVKQMNEHLKLIFDFIGILKA